MARYGRYTYERFVRRDPTIEKEYVLEAQRADAAFTLEALLPSDRARIVRLCARLSGDLDAAEDLAQETLVEAGATFISCTINRDGHSGSQLLR